MKLLFALMKKELYIISILLFLQNMVLYSQTLQVILSPDKSKVDRGAKNGIATIFFDSSIEDLSIVCSDENPNEQIMKDEVDENRWYIKIDVKKDIEADGVCYRHFLLKSPSSGEYYLTTDAIQPNQVLYYTVFLPEIAGGNPLKVNVFFDCGFNKGTRNENVIGLHYTLPERQVGCKSNKFKLYRNLRNNQYDQLYTITTNGLINNINVGDVLTFIPEDKSFNPSSITITDYIVKSNEITCVLGGSIN